MGEVREFKKPEQMCLYCGGEPHPTPLACPRISHLTINEEGYVEGISFWDDFFEEETDPAA